jgi:hypothetical protein
MTNIPIAFSIDFHQHRVIVAVDENLANFETVAGRFAFGPQRVARAAEERDVAALTRDLPRAIVHEADHEHFAAGRILYDCRDQPVQLGKVHKRHARAEAGAFSTKQKGPRAAGLRVFPNLLD